VGYQSVCTIGKWVLAIQCTRFCNTISFFHYFQTLYVEKDLMLCDCPGLVFPSFVSTKAELVVNGILPIDQMRDYLPPVALVSLLLKRVTCTLNSPLC
jgi:hypothetical protein